MNTPVERGSSNLNEHVHQLNENTHQQFFHEEGHAIWHMQSSGE